MTALGARKFGQGGSGLSVKEMFGEERRNQRSDDTVQRRSLIEYATLIPEAQHGPLRLADFPFQEEALYSDEVADAEEVVYPKSNQVGASTGIWRWGVRRCDQFGETGILFFPTMVHVTEFGDERIEPSIEASEYLRRRIPPGHTRRKTMKQIGAGILQLRGVQSKAAVQSVAAQWIAFDEYDDCDPDNVAQAERRISGAAALGKKPRIRRLGRPSAPGYGIDSQWQDSDQRQWHVVCPKCELPQILDFFENVRWRSHVGGRKILRPGRDEYELNRDVTEVWRACASCEASLEGEPILEGYWKAMKQGPGRIPGYHLSRLIVPYTDLRKVVAASRSKKLGEVQAFYNGDLGVAWAASDAMLTDADLEAAAKFGYEEPWSAYQGTQPITAGVDVASERALSMRVSEIQKDGMTRKMIWAGEPENFEEVAKLIDRFAVAICAIDSQPERRSVRGLAAQFPRRVFPVTYDESADAQAWRYDEKQNLIHVNRTDAFDAVIDSIRQPTNFPLQRTPPHWRDQMKSPVRRLIEDARGKPRYVYVATGQHGDDYAHADLYDLVAHEMMRQIQMVSAEQAAREEEVLTDEPAVPSLGPGNIAYEPGFRGQGGY